MIYKINIFDIESALIKLGGTARAIEIQNQILNDNCLGEIPSNYQDAKSFRQTIQRKIEDYCPQAAGFDPAKKSGKFLRIGHGIYSLSASHNTTEFTSIDEIADQLNLLEGAIKTISVNRYERDPLARKICIKHFGCKCFFCGFDFEKTYGEIGKSYIQVHHLIPLSQIRKEYVVDPIEHLRPVCANCHAIIHRTKEPMEPGVLQSIISSKK